MADAVEGAEFVDVVLWGNFFGGWRGGFVAVFGVGVGVVGGGM